MILLRKFYRQKILPYVMTGSFLYLLPSITLHPSRADFLTRLIAPSSFVEKVVYQRYYIDDQGLETVSKYLFHKRLTAMEDFSFVF